MKAGFHAVVGAEVAVVGVVVGGSFGGGDSLVLLALALVPDATLPKTVLADDAGLQSR